MLEMEFSATHDQVFQIFANAVNASKPVGLGKLHYREKVYTSDDVKAKLFDGHLAEICSKNLIEVDYFEGRMVKLSIKRSENEPFDWVIDVTADPKADYQSWADKYPTYEALVQSVLGVKK